MKLKMEVNNMMDKMCNWMNTEKGKMLCAFASTVGGLHLLLTPAQKVLGFLPAFNFTIPVLGKEAGAQQLVGAVLTVCGVCCLKNCM